MICAAPSFSPSQRRLSNKSPRYSFDCFICNELWWGKIISTTFTSNIHTSFFFGFCFCYFCLHLFILIFVLLLTIIYIFILFLDVLFVFCHGKCPLSWVLDSKLFRLVLFLYALLGVCLLYLVFVLFLSCLTVMGIRQQTVSSSNSIETNCPLVSETLTNDVINNTR